jgi:hypothetical protein
MDYGSTLVYPSDFLPASRKYGPFGASMSLPCFT